MARAPEVVRRRRRPGRGGDHGRRPDSGGEPGGLRSVPLLAGAAILLCATISALVVGDHLTNAGRIHRGVSVGDVALGGKTSEEARETLESRAPDTLEQVRLSGSAGSFAVPTEGLDARFDIGATVEAAYAVGRRGNLAQQLGDRARSILDVGVPAEVRIRPGAVRSSLEELAARADEEPKDASVEIYGSDIRVSGSREGYRLDVAATARNLERNLQSLSGEARMYGEVLEPEVTTGEAEAAARDAREAVSGPLVLTAFGKSLTLSPDAVSSSLAVGREGGTLQMSLDRERLREAMAALYADLNVEPVEAGYDVGGGAVPEISVTPGGEGRRIEDEKLLDAIEEGLFEGRREYEVPVAVARPGLTTAGAEKMKPTEMLGSYRTDYSVVPDDGTRVENLGISSEAVSGTLLAPGETFSMLDHVAGLEYNDSKVIVGGRETEADGGGLCQVTSTLYNAANFAGLDVVERTPHSAQLPYIRPGMDATVWWGGPGKEDDLDMKFRNTTGGYLLLREYVAGDGHVYAEIWGRPNGTEVSMRSKPSYLGADGSEWVTYQTVEKDGEVVFDGLLHRDAYEPLVDEDGNTIPPPDVPVAPVNP